MLQHWNCLFKLHFLWRPNSRFIHVEVKNVNISAKWAHSWKVFVTDKQVVSCWTESPSSSLVALWNSSTEITVEGWDHEGNTNRTVTMVTTLSETLNSRLVTVCHTKSRNVSGCWLNSMATDSIEVDLRWSGTNYIARREIIKKCLRWFVSRSTWFWLSRQWRIQDFTENIHAYERS